MFRLAIILTLAIATQAVGQVEVEYTVDQAIDVLNTSLNKLERSNALYALRVAREESAPAAKVLARIIAQNPAGKETAPAAEILNRIGEPSVPLITELSQNGFEWSYIFARHSFAFPNNMDEAFMKSFDPIINGDTNPEKRFNAILVLRWYDLEPATANRLCRLFESRPSETNALAMALFIAPKGDDEQILGHIKSMHTKSTDYVAERIREQWRRRPILEALHRPHVRQHLPPEEKLRFGKADNKLKQLAKLAIPEAISKLRLADDTQEKYLWIEMLHYASEHEPLPYSEMMDLFDSIERKRGGMLDELIIYYQKELSEGRINQAAKGKPNRDPFFDPASDQPPRDAAIQPQLFTFFYPPMNDERFKMNKLLAIELPKDARLNYEGVYLSALARKTKIAKAKTPFLLIGWLPGGGHPSKISHRVLECSIKEQELNCDLEFTYHIIPGAGPGVPTRVFFAAKMPPLPAGEYSIRFQIVKSYLERGDGLMRREHNRDALESQPYIKKFKIGK